MATASQDLTKPEAVEELYYLAVRLRIVPAHSEAMRTNIYIQAAVDVRVCQSSPHYARTVNGEKRLFKRKPGAILRENVLYRRWDHRRNEDVDTAARMMRRATAHFAAFREGSIDNRVAAITAELERRKQERGE